MNSSDFLQLTLVLASTGLAWFCIVLARRLRRLNDLEAGLGGAIAVMTSEIDRLELAIRSARDEAMEAGRSLSIEIENAQKERALWDLKKKINDVVSTDFKPRVNRRLRKRQENLDA